MNIGFPTDVTLYKLLTDWGSVIGGGIALIAGIAAYIAGLVQARATRQAAKMQVALERRREDREVDALRKSLATEIRQMVPNALAAHKSLSRLAVTAGSGHPITARMIEDSSRIAQAVIYPGSASKLGLLDGAELMDLVIVYNLIEIARQAAGRLARGRTPDNITPVTVAAVAEAFLRASQYAVHEVFPKFRTGFPAHDEKDSTFAASVSEAAAAWNNIVESWRKAQDDRC